MVYKVRILVVDKRGRTIEESVVASPTMIPTPDVGGTCYAGSHSAVVEKKAFEFIPGPGSAPDMDICEILLTCRPAESEQN
jgi:hypothetical protein